MRIAAEFYSEESSDHRLSGRRKSICIAKATSSGCVAHQATMRSNLMVSSAIALISINSVSMISGSRICILSMAQVDTCRAPTHLEWRTSPRSASYRPDLPGPGASNPTNARTISTSEGHASTPNRIQKMRVSMRGAHPNPGLDGRTGNLLRGYARGVTLHHLPILSVLHPHLQHR